MDLSGLPLALKIYIWIILAVVLIMYILVCLTLAMKQTQETKTHTWYMLYIHTVMVIAEVWLGLIQPVGLLPNVAFYTVGLQSSLFGLNAHFGLGGFLFWIQVTFLSICQCLLFRWFVITGRKIRGHRVKEKIIHSFYFFHHLVNSPFFFIFYFINSPKDSIPKDAVKKFPILLDNNTFYTDPIHNYFLWGATLAWIWTFFYTSIACLLPTYFVLTILKSGNQYSETTKRMHRKAVFSCLFMFVPPACMIIVSVWCFVVAAVLGWLGVPVPYDVLNLLLTPLFLGASIPVSINTLYQAHQKRFHQAFKRNKKFIDTVGSYKRG